MPELPEVETTKKGLYPQIKNNIIKDVILRFPVLRYPVPQEVKNLKNKQVLDIIRRGKYLVFIFDDNQLIIHLGMSGKIKLLKTNDTYEKHDHFVIVFSDTTLIYNDPRRFGCVLLTKDYTKHKLIINLGPEPLSEEFNPHYLYNLAKNKKSNIKSFIMNSSVVVGVGNIYAAESLFKAGINPTTIVNKISLAKYEKLVKFIKQTLLEAIKNGGTTLQDFKGVSGELGYFAQKLQVYGRNGESCYKCNNLINKIVQNQRATFYCPYCQK